MLHLLKSQSMSMENKIYRSMTHIKFIVLAAMAISLFYGCRKDVRRQGSFVHEIEFSQRPWTESPRDAEGDFSFAIISDLTGGERERIFEVAVEQINRFDPSFVLSVGDLIEGGTEDTLRLRREWDDFDRRAGRLEAPFFHLGGNHDLTNPSMKRFWQGRYGPTYYFFLYNDVLFLMLDSEDYEEERMMEIYKARAKALKMIEGEIEGVYEESEYYHMEERRTGSMSREQRVYFEEALAEHPDAKWTFVLMHKPLWKNEGSSEWKELEKKLIERDYTVINGHYHSFSHEVKNDRNYIMLGTTGGAQSDQDPNSFDHISWVKMVGGRPVISHIRMDGILNEAGEIPIGGDTLSFQAYRPNPVIP